MKIIQGDPVVHHRRFFKSLPFDFSRRTEIGQAVRILAALTLALSLIPLCFNIPLGWAFALRVLFVAGIGVAQNTGLVGRLSLLIIDFSAMLLWMFSGFPTEAGHVAIAVFVLGVSFKSLELRTVGDGYIVSVLSFLGPILAFTQDAPPFIWGLSLCSLPLALLLRSVLSSVEAGNKIANPWAWIYWKPLVSMLTMALPIALFVFFMFPRVPNSLFSFQPRGGSQGISGSMEPGSFIQNFKDESPAFLASFSEELPPKQDWYWRTVVMTHFDGRAWRPAVLARQDEKEPMVPEDKTIYRYALSLMPQRQPYLPLLDRPLNVSGSRAFWTTGQTLVTSSSPNASQDFFVQSSPSALLDFGQEQLPQPLLDANLALPEGFNPKAIALVKKWKDQGLTDQKLIDQTLAYFRKTMTYTYTPPMLGKDTVDELLFETHQGYCEHFSSAFTVMMRAGGIPARVVTGYVGGEVMGVGNTLMVKQMDAHAWVEVWLKEKGWVRIDPTFVITNGRPPPIDNRQNLSQSGSGSWLRWVQEGTREWVGEFDIQKQRALLRQWQFDSMRSWLITAGVAGVLLVCCLTAFWVWPSRKKRVSEDRRQWEHLRALLEKRGGSHASETPRQLIKRLRPLTPPEHWEMLQELLARVEKWDYANTTDASLPKDLKKMIMVERRLKWEQSWSHRLKRWGLKS